MIVGAMSVGAMIVGAMIVGAMIVGTMIVGAMIVGAVRRPLYKHLYSNGEMGQKSVIMRNYAT